MRARAAWAAVMVSVLLLYYPHPSKAQQFMLKGESVAFLAGAYPEQVSIDPDATSVLVCDADQECIFLTGFSERACAHRGCFKGDVVAWENNRAASFESVSSGIIHKGTIGNFEGMGRPSSNQFLVDANPMSGEFSSVPEAVFPVANTSFARDAELTGNFPFEGNPRSLFCLDDPIVLDCGFRRTNSGFRTEPGLFQRIPYKANGPNTHSSASDGGESCDPLCKRILRREKTLGPIPPLWFLAVACGGIALVVLFGGFASYLLIGWITKPRNGPDKE